jgi:Na+/H+ antiporter NhaD/arsenite permease-like protein
MNAIVNEFLPFIVLLFSLFTITGGIRIGGNLKATPFVNSVILFIGAILASFIGTTGAAMLLIRLLLETNKERKYKVHTIVIFIFCVCNCGGCLTPLGDPPLFLGYLRGVAFEWTFHLWVEWTFVNLILIAFYFLWDAVWFYPRESKESKQSDTAHRTSLAISGWMLNVPLLFGVVAAVALLDPGKAVPGTEWHPWFYLPCP